ncbi:MAG: 50S ribosomal protein L18 [Candidatus Izemoplasmatales bacterium]|jgi:large subunit ribosomal protein L18|nr:50S ribosomal protein L18 [Candidatus Izemoplasmatales bacterium]MDD4354578.1 50S ribosomal protein L18 [Candidatus Izemoplasmatales bacterium]MDD4988030.1 50S ribosomal protein L18 [Candidatus Izemoplasmatales bacterium]MDY0372787.1 50S ribosomal protein L18 [Candidatus Izemoplasmatales bacterium]NLF48964.1 50S ribosomal protein L18 [Acholeplasmataceae bacterium]
MFKPVNKVAQRQKRHFRIRIAISGTPSRPRLSIFRSNKAIYCQIIDDLAGNTLVAASSREISGASGGNVEGAKLVGKLIAEKALEKGIKNVVFDRGGFLYHGRVKALAEAARAAGLEF